MALQIGSERMRVSNGSASDVLPSPGRHVWIRHAIPPGGRVALCGARPPLVDVGSTWPADLRRGLRCPVCARFADNYLKVIPLPVQRRPPLDAS